MGKGTYLVLKVATVGKKLECKNGKGVSYFTVVTVNAMLVVAFDCVYIL
jgi:hypothetical protein